MNPDKLFDYLDGKLAPNERTELEERFMSDPEARRELAVARQIHASMSDSREIVGVADPTPTSERGAVLGRRIMIAFSILVFVNVAFGIYAIFFMKDKRHARVRTEQNRTEFAQSLARSAAAALPTPSLEVEEIKFTASVAEQDSLADRVIDGAQQSGGSGTKGLADEHGILIFAEVPTARLDEFRDLMRKLGGTVPVTAAAPSPGEKTILQVRIISAQ
jgi:anti-sigma factor RsiW